MNIYKISQNFLIIVKHQPLLIITNNKLPIGSLFYCTKVKCESTNENDKQKQYDDSKKKKLNKNESNTFSTHPSTVGKNLDDNIPAVIYLADKLTTSPEHNNADVTYIKSSDNDINSTTISDDPPNPKQTVRIVLANHEQPYVTTSSVQKKIDSNEKKEENLTGNIPNTILQEIELSDSKTTEKPEFKRDGEEIGKSSLLSSNDRTLEQINIRNIGVVNLSKTINQTLFELKSLDVGTYSDIIHLIRPSLSLPPPKLLQPTPVSPIEQHINSETPPSNPSTTKLSSSINPPFNPTKIMHLKPYKTEILSSAAVQTKEFNHHNNFQSFISKQSQNKLQKIPPNMKINPSQRGVVSLHNISIKTPEPVPEIKASNPLRQNIRIFKGKQLMPNNPQLSFSNSVNDTLRENKLLTPVTGTSFLQKYVSDPLLNPPVNTESKQENTSSTLQKTDTSKNDKKLNVVKPILATSLVQAAANKLKLLKSPKIHIKFPATKNPSNIKHSNKNRQINFHASRKISIKNNSIAVPNNNPLDMNVKKSSTISSLKSTSPKSDKKKEPVVKQSKMTPPSSQQPKDQPGGSIKTPQLLPTGPKVSSPNIELNNSASSPAEKKGGATFRIPGSLLISFKCKKCNTRNSKQISKHAYTKGVVIIRCDGCHNNHLIADNLNWFTDLGKKRNIEDIMVEKGEKVQKVILPGGIAEYLLESER